MGETATLGSSGSIEVKGGDLVDPFNCAVSPALTDPSIQLTSDPSNTNNFIMEPGASCNASVLTIDYSIGPNASAGNQTFTLANRFGTSNGMTFTVYDPTPVITSVSPAVLQASAVNQQVTITGNFFGVNPCVSFGDPNITVGTPCVPFSGFQTIGQMDSTQTITVTVNVGAQDPGGPSYVYVTSSGYGNGLTTPPPGGSLRASYPTETTPIPPTPPQFYQGPNNQGDGICSSQATNITQSTQQVLVGQQIAFTACIPSVQLAQQTITKYWTIPSNWSTNGLGVSQPAAVAGWSVTNPPSGCSPSPPAEYCNYVARLTDVSATAPQCTGLQSCDFYTFYFVVPGTYTFTFAYTAPGGYAFSSVTYVVSGPTNVNVTLDPNYLGNPFAPVTVYTDNGTAWMGLGQQNGPSGWGLWLAATLTTPEGWNPVNPSTSISWVQVFTSMTIRRLDTSGTWTGYFQGQISPGGGIYSTVLDSSYPYKTGGRYFDAPASVLNYSEFSQNYSSTVYLM